MGIFFALLAMIFWGFEEFFLKEAIQGLKSLTTFVINSVTSVAIVISAVLLTFPEKLTLVSYDEVPLLVVIVINGFLASLLLYLALEKQELSLVSSLDESWIVIATVIAVLAFGELLSPLHILAIGAVLLGAFLISVDTRHLEHLRLISGSKYELGSVALIGLNVPLEKILVTRIGEVNALFYLSVLFLPLLMFGKVFVKGEFIRPTRKLSMFTILSGICDGAAFAFFLFALARADVSLISPIIASRVLISIVLARIYLREHMRPKEIFGAALILLGVITLSSLVDMG